MNRAQLPKKVSSLLVASITIGILTTACGSATITTPSDTSAHNLDIALQIGPSLTAGDFGIEAVFRYQGAFVRFAHGEHVACNGIPLEYRTDHFLGAIPDVPRNYAVSCTYTDSKVKVTTIAFQLPAHPVILSPKVGATLARSKNLPITYTPLPVLQVIVNAETKNVIGRPNQPAGTVGTRCFDAQKQGAFTCDVSSLPPSAGDIQMDFQSDLSVPNTGFHSANLEFEMTTTIDVTWT